MKPYFLIALIIMSLTRLQANADPSCTQKSECFTFKLLGANRFDSKQVKITFAASMTCQSKLDYIAFQLPDGSQAAAPSNTMQQNNDYIVKNGRTNNTGQDQISTIFNAIQFNAKNTAGINNGKEDIFEFYLTNEDYDKLAVSGMRVQAMTKNGTTGTANFSLSTCAPVSNPNQTPPTSCSINAGVAVFGFIDAINLTDGTTIVRFLLTNNTATEVSSVLIETPNTPKTIGVFSDNSGNSYKAKYTYTATVNQTTDVITFQAQNTKGYANGEKDIFAIIVPTDVYNLSPSFSISLNAGTTSTTRSFNTKTCEESSVTPLPVELESFEGKATPSGIALEWTTASERNSASFEIEHSKDGKTFAAIGKVASHGNSNTKQKYGYLDRRALPEVNYYRLKQVDFNGASEYSKLIAVNHRALPSSESMSVYPNPASGKNITIAVDGYDTETREVKVVNTNGKEVFNRTITTGTNRLDLPLDELKLPSGIYLVKLVSSTQTATKKLIIP